MKQVLVYAFSIIAILIALVVLGWSMGWLGRIAQRPIARYEEETRTQTYENSRGYQQGINRDIARYCQQMRSSETDAGKKAIGALIRSTVSTYTGPILPDNQTCVSEAQGM